MDFDKVNPLDFPLPFIFALAATLLLAIPIEAILRGIAERTVIPRPRGISEQGWSQLTKGPDPYAGKWIGHTERFLFFALFLAGVPELIVAWLAFKVTSKWETWNNVYKVPDSLPGATSLEFLLARSRWGNRTLQRSLVGTAANIGAAIIGLAVFYIGVRIQKSL